jgi:hypothetical protein
LLVRIFFFVAQSAKFFPEFNIRLDDKNSELHYFFFLHQNQNISINCQLKNIILTLLSSIFSVKIYIIQALINISAFILKSWDMLAVLIVSTTMGTHNILEIRYIALEKNKRPVWPPMVNVILMDLRLVVLCWWTEPSLLDIKISDCCCSVSKVCFGIAFRVEQ